MNDNHPFEKIRQRWHETNSMAGVGIDPDLTKIPEEIWNQVGGKENIADGFFLFSKKIIDATQGIAVDYKVNANFFSRSQGRLALSRVFSYLKRTYPKVLRVCDGKFADVENTSEKLAEEIFGDLDADAVVLNPYLGFDAIKPFVEWKDKIVLLCINTSNPSAGEIQELSVEGEPLWVYILKKSMTEWNLNGNIIPILSATHPKMLKNVRSITGEIPILLAGVGVQGGSLSESIPYLLNNDGYGLMISSSRGIIYAKREINESIGDAALRELSSLRDKINFEASKVNRE